MAANRRPLHDDEACALKVTHDPLGSDSRHVFIGLMDAPAPLKPERIGDRIGEVFRIGGASLSFMASEDTRACRT